MCTKHLRRGPRVTRAKRRNARCPPRRDRKRLSCPAVAAMMGVERGGGEGWQGSSHLSPGRPTVRNPPVFVKEVNLAVAAHQREAGLHSRVISHKHPNRTTRHLHGKVVLAAGEYGEKRQETGGAHAPGTHAGESKWRRPRFITGTIGLSDGHGTIFALDRRRLSSSRARVAGERESSSGPIIDS